MQGLTATKWNQNAPISYLSDTVFNLYLIKWSDLVIRVTPGKLEPSVPSVFLDVIHGTVYHTQLHNQHSPD